MSFPEGPFAHPIGRNARARQQQLQRSNELPGLLYCLGRRAHGLPERCEQAELAVPRLLATEEVRGILNHSPQESRARPLEPLAPDAAG